MSNLVRNEIIIDHEMSSLVKVRYLSGNLFSQDNGGNEIGVRCFFNGEPNSLAGATVSANVIRADGSTVAITTGSIYGDDNNIALVNLTQACYAVPGVISIVIKIAKESRVTTIGAFVTNVYRSATDTVIDPGTVLPSIQTLISQINTAVASIPADYSSLWTSMAPVFSTSATYTVGQYTTYNGKVYRFTSDHSGAWNASHATAVDLGGEIGSLKGALEYKTGDITREMTYIRGENLIRNDSTMKSGYMALDGTVYSNSGLVYSEHIPVLEGDTIKAYNTQEGVFAQKPLRFVTAFNSSGEAVTASGLNNGWIYTVPSGIVEVVVTMVTGTNYMISLESVVTAYKPFTGHYIATEDFLGEVFTNALSQKVDKDGLSQVSSNNIEDLIKTDKHIQSRNLFANATLVAQNQYVAGIGSTSGKAYLLASQGLDTYIIPVDGVSVYSFTNCRTAIVVSDLEYTPVGSLLTYATSINSSGGAYILFSFNPTTYPVTDYSITKPIPVYKAINWEIENGIQKQAVASKSGSIADGGALTIDGRSALKDGQMITFVGTVSSFGVGFELEFWNTSVVTNNIVVDATNISVKYNTSEVVPVAHGLDINNANTVAVTVQFDKGKAKIKLYANGSVYSAEYDWYQTNGTVTQPRVKSNGAVFSDSDLVITYDSANRGIWVFGDSYLSLTSDARWPYYLNADGYADNALMSGSPGCTTYASSTALTALLTYGTPKFAVLATGMNDGSDTNGQAASLWVTYRDAFLALCEAQGITPVFCTIPTVPTVNNETKNAWIRSSGYRYIDFAKAVGANSSGVWYSGMLSGDNVHPTATGAKALYTQVLIDLPEITIHYGLSK